ncbi:MAG: DUF802 domain-containing protein [Cellvibrionaceae bacterium]|nr:DUF802 domain-containing protein [Cellvibrionaceae bacterium]
MVRFIFSLAFLLGAAAVAWMAAIFIGADALALTVTLVIAGVFVLGSLELWYFRRATASLSSALDQLSAPLEQLPSWLQQVAPALRNSVQARIEGERVALPAPVLSPYLVGLLVMLGLLGTFVGMVETLQGAVTALQGNNELQAIRAGLAAPIQGLGLAFGTSVAGVAASAMLGLMSTLSRRERILETRRLDQCVNTHLRHFSLNHSRQQTYRALQQQADTLPAVAERLDSLALSLERMAERMGQQLLANQQGLNKSVQELFGELANSVAENLSSSVQQSNEAIAKSSQQAVASLQPIMQQALQDIDASLSANSEATGHYLREQAQNSFEQLQQSSRETLDQLQASSSASQAALLQTNQRSQEQISAANTQQLQLINQRFEDTAAAVAKAWEQGLGSQQQANQNLLQHNRESLTAFSEAFEQLGRGILNDFGQASEAWLAQQQRGESERLRQWQTNFSSDQERAAAQLHEARQQLNQQLQQHTAAQQQANTQLLQQFENLASSVAGQWRDSAAEQQQQQQQLADCLSQTTESINGAWQQNASQMVAQITAAVSSAEQLLNNRIDSEQQYLQEHRQRMDGLSSVLAEQLQQLRQEEQGRADHAVARLGQLEQAVAAHLAELGQALEAPMARLIETASAAPRAAAEVIEHLRAEISKNIERDNGLLSERRDILFELNRLSQAITDTAGGQQQAIETLVAASGDKLETIAELFAQQVSDESSKLSDMAALFAGSSADMSALGEAFGVAVDIFAQANGQMLDKLGKIETALVQSSSRSDEQLGYYVAQAREIIDQSVLSQQQMLDGLAQLRDAERAGV